MTDRIKELEQKIGYWLQIAKTTIKLNERREAEDSAKRFAKQYYEKTGRHYVIK